MRKLILTGLVFAITACGSQEPGPQAPQRTAPADSDGDGIADLLDNCPDTDNPFQADLDGDDLGDLCDDDRDGDGTANVDDCAPEDAAINPAVMELPGNQVDDDCDGYADNDRPGCGATCSGSSLDALICALDLCPDDPELDAFELAAPGGDDLSDAAIALERFGADSNDLAPLAGFYTLLSTGVWDAPDHDSALPGGVSLSDPFTGGGLYDIVELRLELTAPADATGFGVRYVFLSMEYDEFVGTQFNDKFYLELTAPTTTGGQPTVINTTACREPSQYFDLVGPDGPACYIAVNSAFSESCADQATDISGTGYEVDADGACTSGEATGSSTGWLATLWPIVGGESFTLTFRIADTGDDRFDSAALLDAFSWLTGSVEGGTGRVFEP